MQKRDAVDAAQVIMNIRPDWQQPGIMAALLQMPADLSYAEAVAHACLTAANPTARTPAAINIMLVEKPATTLNTYGPSCDVCSKDEHTCQKAQRKLAYANQHQFTRRTA